MRRTLSALAALALATVTWSRTSLEHFMVQESWMLSFVERHASPACPCPRDPAASTGVVVAEIEVTPTGRLISIGILEAPTLLVAHCVQSALRAWTFRTVGGKSSVRYWTKIHWLC
jgi:hypothetical protein